MIERTFQLVRGIGPWRERDLWARGISDWSRFPEPGQPVAVSERLDDEARAKIAACRAALAKGDLSQLSRLIPSREHWRLYARFKEQAVFFDIEAESSSARIPTVVTLFHREGIETFIRDRNLDELPDALARWPVWVTFNGSTFDIPALENFFDELPRPILHLDARFACRRVGWNGGLKQVEEDLGIGRPPHLKTANGHDAVVLWQVYRRTGDIVALRYLVEYNAYDAIQLRSVMDRAYNRAAEQLACDIVPLRPFDRGDVLYELSQRLLEISPTALDLKRLGELRASYNLLNDVAVSS